MDAQAGRHSSSGVGAGAEGAGADAEAGRVRSRGPRGGAAVLAVGEDSRAGACQRDWAGEVTHARCVGGTAQSPTAHRTAVIVRISRRQARGW